MKVVTKVALAAISALTLTAGAASAAIVCNDEGECWHARGNPAYEPGLKLSIHPDSWKWGRAERFRFREHEGHGYWRKGVWVEIR